MRSVRIKLTLAFLMVGLLGLAVGAVFASRTASGAFQRFTFARNQDDIVARLESHYQEYGNWDDLAGSFPPFQQHVPGAPQIPLREPGVLLITDADGRIILPAPGRQIGEQVAADVLAGATPIKAGGETVGWLVVPAGCVRPDARRTAIHRAVEHGADRRQPGRAGALGAAGGHPCPLPHSPSAGSDRGDPGRGRWRPAAPGPGAFAG